MMNQKNICMLMIKAETVLTLFFVLVAASVDKAGLCVRHRELPLQQAGLLLITQLGSRADSLQALLTAGGAVHSQGVRPAQAVPLQAFPARLSGRRETQIGK